MQLPSRPLHDDGDDSDDDTNSCIIIKTRPEIISSLPFAVLSDHQISSFEHELISSPFWRSFAVDSIGSTHLEDDSTNHGNFSPSDVTIEFEAFF